MLPLAFLRVFYMVFIGLFLLVYTTTAHVTFTSARVGDLPPTFAGWALAILSVLLVGMAMEELRRVSPQR
jgi:hypothetical protein